MQNSGRGYKNEFRIIGGEWRRRRFRFPSLPGIRPSPDRVRETLFNWLQQRIVGARCLDLFAGSGALGLEALSRGAAACLFVDHEAQVIEALSAHLAALHAATGELVRADAGNYLAGPPRPFDLVFLDPPFQSGLLQPALTQLVRGGWLAPEAWVYLECAPGGMPALPAGWGMLRNARAGQVEYGLAAAVGLPAA